MVDVSQLAGQAEYAKQTTVHPVGLIAVAVLGVCVLLLDRRWSVLPFLIMACFVSSAQRIVIMGMDFDFLRIMVLFGTVRVLLRREHNGFIWKPLDTAIVLWACSTIVIYTFQQGTSSALVNRLGVAFDTFGMYFLFRCMIRKWEDIDRLILGIIIISIPVAAFFLLENRTGHNLFSIFGGVPATTVVREGRLRCQGAYAHAILAGCFWASLMPFIAAGWWKDTKQRMWVIVGLTASFVIVVCSASSTPLMGIVSGMTGGAMFLFRRRMRSIRWAIVFTLVMLQMVMESPVWHLIARMSAVGGSTGWHRYNLMNQAIMHFNDWWLIGCSGETVASWGVYAGDVTNQYLVEGIRGGLLTMGLFIAIITIAFREVGKIWRLQSRYPYGLALSWSLGVALFIHCVNFIGVAYFGQIHIVWYLSLAMIGSMAIRAQFVPQPPGRIIRRDTLQNRDIPGRKQQIFPGYSP